MPCCTMSHRKPLDLPLVSLVLRCKVRESDTFRPPDLYEKRVSYPKVTPNEHAPIWLECQHVHS